MVLGGFWEIVLWTSVFCGCISSLKHRVDYHVKNMRRIPDGFDHPTDISGAQLLRPPKKPKKPIRVFTVEDLKDLFRQGYRVDNIDVRGDIATLLDESAVHPVVKDLYERKLKRSQPGNRDFNDTARIAIAIEGGGMRGCVAAGMISVSQCGT